MFKSLRRIWPLMRPFKGDVILVFALGILVAASGGLIPVFVKLLMSFYDHTAAKTIFEFLPRAWAEPLVGSDERLDTFAHYFPLFVPVLYLVYGLFRYLHFAIMQYTSEQIVARLRSDLMRKILRLNLTFHGALERGSGVLLSRVFNDTLLLKQGLSFYADLIREPIQAVVFLAYMFWEDWRLSLFAILFLPFYVWTTKKISKSLRKYGILGRDAMEDLTSVMKETIDGARVIQSFNLESRMEDRFAEHQTAYLKTAKKISVLENIVSPLNEFMVSLLVMAFAFYSIDQVMHHQVEGAKFVSFLIAAGLLQMPIKRLQDANVKIQQAYVVSDRIYEILESTSEVPQSNDPKSFPKNWQTIEFRNVSFSYGNETVLKNINLTVKRGEIIALVGESGSGKSTMVNLLERFYDATSGEILIDGINILDFKLSELRSNIALVTQDVFLFRDSIERNIQAGDFSKALEGTVEASRMANAHTFVTATRHGYKNNVGERGSLLSGGEKQRVSIARAIFKDAPILILDEATSALDSVSEMEVQKGLTQLMAGRTAFVIAHRLSTVFSADRILVMKKGVIVEQGNHRSLVEMGGEYNSFFQLQVTHTDRS